MDRGRKTDIPEVPIDSQGGSWADKMGRREANDGLAWHAEIAWRAFTGALNAPCSYREFVKRIRKRHQGMARIDWPWSGLVSQVCPEARRTTGWLQRCPDENHSGRRQKPQPLVAAPKQESLRQLLPGDLEIHRQEATTLRVVSQEGLPCSLVQTQLVL